VAHSDQPGGFHSVGNAISAATICEKQPINDKRRFRITLSAGRIFSGPIAAVGASFGVCDQPRHAFAVRPWVIWVFRSVVHWLNKLFKLALVLTIVLSPEVRGQRTSDQPLLASELVNFETNTRPRKSGWGAALEIPNPK